MSIRLKASIYTISIILLFIGFVCIYESYPFVLPIILGLIFIIFLISTIFTIVYDILSRKGKNKQDLEL